jgi:hypothetical protein
VGSIGEAASQEAGAMFDKVSEDYPALYREHAAKVESYSVCQIVSQRISLL